MGVLLMLLLIYFGAVVLWAAPHLYRQLQQLRVRRRSCC